MSAVLLDMEGGMGKGGTVQLGPQSPEMGTGRMARHVSRSGERLAERDRKKTEGQVLQEAGRRSFKSMIRPSMSQVYCLFKKKKVLVRKRVGELSHPSVSGRIQAERRAHVCSFSFNSWVKMSFWLLAIKICNQPRKEESAPFQSGLQPQSTEKVPQVIHSQFGGSKKR